jgi:hypothetical protein
MPRHDLWNRCDICGRFIAYKDFDHGAVRTLLTPDSDRSREEWETLCRIHRDGTDADGQYRVRLGLVRLHDKE